MKDEFIRQYAHTWRVFEKLVKDFDPEAWLHTGRNDYTPVRLSLHILKAAKFYIEDSSPIHLASGKLFDKSEWEIINEANTPTQDDILAGIDEIKGKTETWLSGIDLAAKNTSFDWAGETKSGVVIFLLRHFLYHLGELSCLLNESKNGKVEDHYVNA